MKRGDIFLRIKELLCFVFHNKYSKFYHLKYEGASFNPYANFNIVDDIKRIPLLNKKELYQENPFQLLFIPIKEVCFISTTSGTTGKKIITFHSKDFLGHPPAIETGHKKIFILANSLRVPDLYLAQQKLKRLPLAGNIYNLPTSCEIASKIGVNHIVTTPTLAIILKKYLINYPDLDKNVCSFILSGELVNKEKRGLLKKLYPNKGIFFTYGISEMGGSPAFQCHALSLKEEKILYHLRIDDCYFEIINPDTEKDVPFGEIGELVLTNLRDLATPLIRYKTGDLVSLHKNDCPCGYPGPLIQIWGRAKHDFVKAGGVELKKEMAEKLILNLRNYLEESFEIHIYENFIGNKPRIKMQFHLSLKKGVKENLEIKQKIKNELSENWQLSPKLNLKKVIEAGIFEPLQINFVQFSPSAKTKQVLILHPGE